MQQIHRLAVAVATHDNVSDVIYNTPQLQSGFFLGEVSFELQSN